MLSANGFEGMLTKISTKRIQEKSFAAGDGRDASDSVVLRLNVRHVDATNSANRFVESLQKELNALNVKSAFALPISWKSVAFEFPSPLALVVDFDGNEFDAQLLGMKVRQIVRKDSLQFVFDLDFQKEVQPEDAVLYEYLNKREVVEEGKKPVLASYAVQLSVAK